MYINHDNVCKWLTAALEEGTPLYAIIRECPPEGPYEDAWDTELVGYCIDTHVGEIATEVLGDSSCYRCGSESIPRAITPYDSLTVIEDKGTWDDGSLSYVDNGIILVLFGHGYSADIINKILSHEEYLRVHADSAWSRYETIKCHDEVTKNLPYVLVRNDGRTEAILNYDYHVEAHATDDLIRQAQWLRMHDPSSIYAVRPATSDDIDEIVAIQSGRDDRYQFAQRLSKRLPDTIKCTNEAIEIMYSYYKGNQYDDPRQYLDR